MKTLETTPENAAAVAEVRLEAGGRAVVVLRGRLDSLTAMGPWRLVEQRLHRVAVAALEVDAGGLEYCDGAGMALLHCLQMGFLTPGAQVTVRGLTPELQRSYDNFSAADYRASVPPPPEPSHIPTDLGRGARAMVRDFVEQVRFIGAVTQGLAGTLFRPRLLRWDEVMRVFESAGANALPIVSLISLLVGLVIAFEAAQPLALPAAPESTSASGTAVLLLRSVVVAPMFDAKALVYRLGEHTWEQDPYAEFLVPPAAMLAGPLRTALRRSGVFRDVIEPGSALTPDRVAEIQVTEFYGDFRNKAEPAAVLSLRCTIFDTGSKQPVRLQKEYARRLALPERTAAGVVAGWNEALGQILGELVADLQGR